MSDANGREYAKLSQLKPGDMVQVGAGFTCIDPHHVVPVDKIFGTFMVPCSKGWHNLDGQLAEDGDTLVGVYPA